MSDKGRHPTEILVDDITRFTDDIESLQATLPLFMIITGALKDKTHEEYVAFVSTHSEVKEKADDFITYTLSKIEDIEPHKRLRREYYNFKNAYRLIPRNFITSLVAQYDAFLGSLIRFMFAVRPEMLNSSDRSLSFADLARFPDIEAARTYIVEKEIETVIRKNHSDQFDWLKEKVKIPFNKELPCWPDFIELTERRNLFVHVDGRISSQYLSTCSQQKCNVPSEAMVGDELDVTPEYFETAYKRIYEIGVKMAHVMWRKLCPELIDKSDENITNITYYLIQKGEYDLAIRILKFFTDKKIKHASDINRRIMLINLAQAFKWSNAADLCNGIIDSEDWSACEDKFKLAITVLREDYPLCYDLIRQLQYDPKFHKSVYKNWPLFKELRKQEQFAVVYEECYKESFTIEETTEGRIEIEQDVIQEVTKKAI